LPDLFNLDAINVSMFANVCDRRCCKAINGIFLIVRVVGIEAELGLDRQNSSGHAFAADAERDPRKYCVVVLDEVLIYPALYSHSSPWPP